MDRYLDSPNQLSDSLGSLIAELVTGPFWQALVLLVVIGLAVALVKKLTV